MEKNEPQKNKGGRPKGSKNVTLTNAEIQDLRKRSIDKIFQDHISYTQYIVWCKKNFSLSKDRCNKYWKDSWKTVEEKFKMEKDKMITKHINAYWDLYSKSVDKGDFNTARQTLNDLARMGGLNEPDAVDINHMGEITFKFGDEN